MSKFSNGNDNAGNIMSNNGANIVPANGNFGNAIANGNDNAGNIMPNNGAVVVIGDNDGNVDL